MKNEYITKLQNTLNLEIPITNSIGIHVFDAKLGAVTLTAPLQNNINHKSTAFGGSLYSVAVLAGWSMLFLRLDAAGLHPHIVIQESSIKYLHPVTEDIKATCRITNDTFAQFSRIFKKRGRARVILDVEIMCQGRLAVEFQGKYVVHS